MGQDFDNTQKVTTQIRRGGGGDKVGRVRGNRAGDKGGLSVSGKL